MKLLILIAVLVASTKASPLEETRVNDYDWNNFKIKYNRNYTLEEDAIRQKIFEANAERIKEHNRRFYDGEESDTWEVNQFADMTAEELSRYRGLIKKDDTNDGYIQ